ncbi:MAG: histidinol-phosphatase HisJ family protein [Fusobacteriaceae bacterium]
MIDGHMHLEYGPLSKEYVLEFVKVARERGIKKIQILDHTHRFKEFSPIYDELKKIPEQKNWLEMKKLDSVEDFINLMEEIKKMDLNGVEVLYGLEVCYSPANEDFLRNLLNNYKFDFLVGAVHSINGILYDMNFSKKILWDKFNVDDIYRDYYEIIFKLVKSGIFSQLAHPDTIKMFNYYPSYDLTKTYEELAKLLKKYNVKAENNTGCHYRYGHKDIGLSDELLKIFKNSEVQIITASDAHHPKDVGSFIREANEKFLNI